MKKRLLIAVAVIVGGIGIGGFLGYTQYYLPKTNYETGITLMEEGSYEEAIVAFVNAKGYADSAEKIEECEAVLRETTIKYAEAVAAMDDGEYRDAYLIFEKLEGYEDSAALALQCHYQYGKEYLENAQYGAAKWEFEQALEYGDSEEMIKETRYCLALDMLDTAHLLKGRPEYKDTVDYLVSEFTALGNYKESEENLAVCLILQNGI